MRIRSLHCLPLLIGLAFAPAQAVQPVRAPVVVYSGAQAVPAAPYIQSLAQTRSQSDSRVNPTPKPGVMPLEKRLPLMPRQLRPGSPALRRTEAPVQPFFVMGMDRASLDWLARTLPTLLSINATGMVVQAANRDDWLLLQKKAQAAGLSLALYPDTGLTEAYGITTYPVLVVPQGILELDRAGEGGP
ncbi:PFL_4695 family integrating conjugative element protein [Haliea salexigens]|uniref:PFL_4695 family integrating conjugative element protein n=1 Tax=Haliea salexigens TaxID=287487 RepID=UPI000688BD53|nr:integrating conjugative element protein [Haliea salexigens]